MLLLDDGKSVSAASCDRPCAALLSPLSYAHAAAAAVTTKYELMKRSSKKSRSSANIAYTPSYPAAGAVASICTKPALSQTLPPLSQSTSKFPCRQSANTLDDGCPFPQGSGRNESLLKTLSRNPSQCCHLLDFGLMLCVTHRSGRFSRSWTSYSLNLDPGGGRLKKTPTPMV